MVDVDRPSQDASEAALVPDLDVIPVETLGQLVMHLNIMLPIAPCTPEHRKSLGGTQECPTDFEICGQEPVMRALGVSAASGYCILMSGPPGSGNTRLARALPSILPRMTIDETLEVTEIYSVPDMLPPGQPLQQQRPFRAPHRS